MTYTYDPISDTGLFRMGVGGQNVVFNQIFLGGSNGTTSVLNGRVALTIQLDGNGNLIGPFSATDIVITATQVAGQPMLTSPLLTGRVTQFLNYTTNGADTGDIIFEVTGGSLAALYAGRQGHMAFVLESPTPAHGPQPPFKASFGAKPKGSILPRTLCGGEIGDYVWHDQNQNGLQDDGLQAVVGIDGVLVQLQDALGNPLLNAVTRSNPKGDYRFADLCPATYKVYLPGTGVPAGFTPTIGLSPNNPTRPDDSNAPNPFVVTLPTPPLGNVNHTIDFGFISPCTGEIGDFVWIDANTNGLQDQGEVGLGGVTVELVDAGTDTVRQTATTDAGAMLGKYVFTGVCPGLYYVRFLRPPNYTFTTPNVSGAPPQPLDSDATTQVPATQYWRSVNFPLAHAQKDYTWDAGVVPDPAGLGDRLWQDTNGNGFQDPSEPGIPGGTVTLFTCQGVQVGVPQLTGANGFYQFLNLAPGSYYVLFSNPNPALYSGFTTQYAGGPDPNFTNDTDSNVYPAGPNTGKTDCVTLGPGDYNPTLDAGVLPKPPTIEIKKYTNGADADDPDLAGVPVIAPAAAVTWTYHLTNPGTVPVPRADITVTDSQLGVVPAPVLVGGFVSGDTNTNNLLEPGETWLYRATGTALNLLLQPPPGITVTPNVCRQGNVNVPGRTAYTNIGTVTIPGASDTDPSSYCNPEPRIQIVKTTNGINANNPDAAGVPEVAPGGQIIWRYRVSIPTGGTIPVPRSAITVTDNEPGVTPAPVTSGGIVSGDTNANNILEPGEIWIYRAIGTALNLLLPPPPGVIVTPNVCRQGDITVPGHTAYTNIGTVTIPGASDTDPSSYCNPEPAIEIVKLTNGADANDPDAAGVPVVAPGATVTWRYLVGNPGTIPVPRAVITVTDNQTGVTPAPVLVGAFVSGDVNTNDLLEPGETWIYEATGAALNLLLPPPPGVTVTPNVCRQGNVNEPGRTAYTNIGTVTIPGASDTDPSSYCIPKPRIDIKKYTNGADADDPNAAGVPEIAAGAPVTWTYRVTNPGTVPVPRASISVTDNQAGVTPVEVVVGGFVSGDANTNNLLEPGETWLYQATGVALDLLLPPPPGVTVTPNVCRQGNINVPGRTAYTNIGTVTIPGASDTDPSSYCNPRPSIRIVKLTNGADANDPDAPGVPEIVPGGLVTWTYLVTNVGTTPIPRADVNVTDSQSNVFPAPVLVGGFVSGDTNTNNVLDPGETWTYQATGVALNLLLPPPTGITVTPNVCRQGDVNLPGRTAYTNVGTVTIPGGSASDPSSYCNPRPRIGIIKYTNGFDANDPDAAGVPVIAPGANVTWTYHVSNPGTIPVPRASIVVTDNQAGVTPVEVLFGAFVSGDNNFNNMLEPGEIWVYQATGTALNLLLPPPQGVTVKPNVCRQGDVNVPGRTAYTNIGTVTIPGATARDPSSYCNPGPRIEIVKLTNGADANDPDAAGVPEIAPGATVTWRYLVGNPGTIPVPRAVITVTDNQTGVTPAPVLVGAFVSGDVNTNDLLEPGETWIYEATGAALNLLLPPPPGVTVTPNVCRQGNVNEPGRTAYTNTGTVTIPGASDTDPSSYCNPRPRIDIVKLTNGADANDPDAAGVPEIAPGATVTWTYGVTNPGTVPVPRASIAVTDSQAGVTPAEVVVGGFVSGDSNTNNLLEPGETWLYRATGTALNLVLPPPQGVTVTPNVCRQGNVNEPGRTAYTNVGTVTIPGASDTDPSSYCNPKPQIGIKKYTNGADAQTPNNADVPNIAVGGVVTWRYDITNPGTVPVPRANIAVTDDHAGVAPAPVLVGAFVLGDANTNNLLEPGETWIYQATGVALNLALTPLDPGKIVAGVCTHNGTEPPRTGYVNMGTVTIPGPISASDPSAYCNPPVFETCDVTLTKQCAVIPAPSTYVCTRPIDSLSMIWNGAQAVDIKAWKGLVGSSTLLATVNGVAPGQEVTVTGYAGAPNDVIWEIFAAGTNTKLGESDFHISCSDDDMDGPEDCGKLEGDAKGLSGFLNQWIFEGMSGGGQTLDCTLTPRESDWRDSCDLVLGDTPGCASDGKPTALTFKYDPKACYTNNNNPQSGKYICSGTTPGSPVSLSSPTAGLVFNPATVSAGQEFTVTGTFGTQTVFNVGTQSISIHTSCSQVLEVGNTFDSLTLVGFNGDRGGSQVAYRYIVTNNSSGTLAYNLIDRVGATIVNSYMNQTLGVGATMNYSDFVTTIGGSTTNVATVTGTVGTGPQAVTCQATDSVTVEMPPTPPCSLTTATPAPTVKDKLLRWSIKNGGKTAVTLQNVIAVWPSANGYLSKVKLDGDTPWDGTINCANGTCFANITSAMMVADTTKKSIKAGATRVFALEFQYNASTDLTKYSLLVDFGGGCVLSHNADPNVCSTSAVLGDYVWFDANNNGIQDAVEVGAAGVGLTLKALNGTVLGTTSTDGLGKYRFDGANSQNLCAGGIYIVEMTPPAGYSPAQTKAAGSTNGNDSNPNPSVVTVPSGGQDLTIDFGLIDGINYCPTNPITGFTGPVGTLWAIPLPAGTPAPAGSPYAGQTFATDVVVIRYDQSFKVNDNTYGTGSSWGHTFSNLTGSDMGQFAIYNSGGQMTLGFKIDYLTATASAVSGYASLGVLGGEGGIVFGNGSWVLDSTTSLDANLNNYGYCPDGANGVCKTGTAKLFINSGPTANTKYASTPNFSLINAYYAVVDAAAFGPGGLGSITNMASQVRLVTQHNSPQKIGSFTPTVCK